MLAIPTQLRCEYATNPLGIDVAAPRFSWRVETDRNGAAQRAFRLLVASTPELLAQNRGDLWDSGKIDDRQSANIPYAGLPLKSRQRCHWKVCVWDSEGNASDFSQPAWFEMALLHQSDWAAAWIGALGSRPGPAKYFRCVFNAPGGIKSARLYITATGYLEAYVNGQRLGGATLDPAYTDISRRIFYNTHDVTAHLRQGKNVVGAITAPGWHGRPALLGQLEIEFENGERMVVSTNRTKFAPDWLAAAGPITETSLFDGEHYDARKAQPDWCLPEYNTSSVNDRTSGWIQVFAVRGPAGRLQAQPLEPIRVVRELPAVALNEPKPGTHVFDFGQNHAGWAMLRVTGPRGTNITLKYSETLRDDGTVNQDNLRTAHAVDQYIMSGQPQETWHPQFTYHGYRYVQVEGWPGKPAASDLTSCVVRSSVAARGTFASDNELLNRIHALVRWTEESNLHGIPTDCPQRDERMGWLNDLAARSEELVYNFDSARLLAKFMTDIADAQDPQTGALSDTVPFHWGRQPADPVSVCHILIGWLLYQHHGDKRVLSENYDGMRAWVDYLGTRAEDYIVEYSYYGDWAPPAGEAIAGSIGTNALSAHTPGPLISTAFYYYAASLLEKIANILNNEKDAATYAALAARVKDAFHKKFWAGDDTGYGSGNQACNSIALHMGLAPDDARPQVLAALLRDIEAHDHHLTTGNLCTKYLLEVLSAEGHFDTAMRIATQTTYPGWGYMLENGATTLWERWELLTGGGMNSHNHPMLGSVGSWLYRWVAGLALAPPCAERTQPHFIIRPPASTLLNGAEATLSTLWGDASVKWRKTNGQIRVQVRIPWNCSATVCLGDNGTHEMRAGNYIFTSKLNSATPVETL